jgi:hypothetical protein
MRNVTLYLRPSTLVAIAADLQHTKDEAQPDDDTIYERDLDTVIEILIDTMGEEEAMAAIAKEIKENF